MRNKNLLLLLVVVILAAITIGCSNAKPTIYQPTLSERQEGYERELANELRFVDKNLVKGWVPERCMVLKKRFTPGYFDSAGRFPTGSTYYNAAILPIIESEEVPDQAGRKRRVYRAVVRSDIKAIEVDNPRKFPYVLVWFDEDDVVDAADWRTTEWATTYGSYETVEPEVSSLCSWSKEKRTIVARAK